MIFSLKGRFANWIPDEQHTIQASSHATRSHVIRIGLALSSESGWTTRLVSTVIPGQRLTLSNVGCPDDVCLGRQLILVRDS